MNSPFCESAFSATIRPIIATSVDGLIFIDNHLLAIDSRNGYLLLINPKNSVTKIVNNSSWQDFIGAKGLCISENKLWFTSREYIYYCSIEWEKDNLVITSKPFCAFSLSYPANGIAVWENTIYITTQKTGHILVYSLDGTAITKFYAPGIGAENITVKGEEIWLCDSIEQTVYCLDRATGDVKYSILTPFESPTALAFCYDEKLERIFYMWLIVIKSLIFVIIPMQSRIMNYYIAIALLFILYISILMKKINILFLMASYWK